MADLIGQIAQQLQELKDQLTAAEAEKDSLRKELAAKDRDLANMSMPRLTRLRREGDLGYVDTDDVKTVRDRLADRDAALKELKEMSRRKPSDVVGQKLRKHEWKMTGIADLPTPEWQQYELDQEAKLGIEAAVEVERSPSPILGHIGPVSRKHTVRAADRKHHEVRTDPGGQTLEGRLPSTPQHYYQEQCRREQSEDRKPAPPRQDTVMRSVEAPPVRPSNISHEAVVLANRKPVCASCREHGGWCDSLALCGNCSRSGNICVYKKCRSGSRCAITRCVYMHPDQWSEHDNNPAWRVEEGSMRVQNWQGDPRRRASKPERVFQETYDQRPRQAGVGSIKRSHSSLDAHEEGFIRKSICVHCFDTSTLCDFNGRCMPCREVGIKCVRVHCKQGLACRSRKCPCVHPGQYDVMDTTWNVEHRELWKTRA